MTSSPSRALCVSIVINTYNRAPQLAVALNAITFQRYPHFEVIVVNGPSTDGTADILAAYPQVKHLDCPERNLSMSRNIGIAAAAGDIVCFLDDDAIPEPFWLERIVAAYAPDIDYVGGYLRDHTGVQFQCKVVACDEFGGARFFDSMVSKDFKNHLKRGAYVSPTGANVSFRRAALLDVGGFDENFHYFLDETDVCCRIHEAGGRGVFAPNADVHHKYAPSHLRSVTRVPHTLFQPAKSKAYFVMRHGGSRHSGDRLKRELQSYQEELRRANRELRRSHQIDAEKEERLNREVAEGVAAGVTAASLPQLLGLGFPYEERRDPPVFSEFPVRLPAHRRLRIGFVCRDYPPNKQAGIGLWTASMAQGLAAKGHEISVVAEALDGQASIDFEDGVWVHRIAPASPNLAGSPLASRLPPALGHFAMAAREAIAGVHLYRGLDVVSSPIWDCEGAALIDWGVLPVVVSLHTTAAIAAQYKPGWRKKSYREGHVDKVVAVERDVLSRAGRLLGNSQSILSELADSDGAYGVDVGHADVVPHGCRDFLKETPLPDPRGGGTLRALFFGRIEYRKGADIVLDAAPELLKAHPTLEIRFVGDDQVNEGHGPLKNLFLERHKNADWLHRIRFMGMMERSELFQELAQADIVLTPSRYESFGLVYLEAMAMGKPCIAMRAGAATEIFTHMESGVLFDRDSVSSFKEAFSALAEDTELRRHIGTKARDIFLTRYRLDQMISGAEKFYAQTIADHWNSIAPQLGKVAVRAVS